MIEKFEYYTWDITKSSKLQSFEQNGVRYGGINEILTRPVIRYHRTEGTLVVPTKINFWLNQKVRLDISHFTQDELLAISQLNGIDFMEDWILKIEQIPLHFERHSNIELIDYDNRTDIIIATDFWHHGKGARNNSEDRTGEDCTIIHGIWEAPLLPDSLIKKLRA